MGQTCPGLEQTAVEQTCQHGLLDNRHVSMAYVNGQHSLLCSTSRCTVGIQLSVFAFYCTVTPKQLTPVWWLMQCTDGGGGKSGVWCCPEPGIFRKISWIADYRGKISFPSMEKSTSAERGKLFQAGERKKNWHGFFQFQEWKIPRKSWNSITIFYSV